MEKLKIKGTAYFIYDNGIKCYTSNFKRLKIELEVIDEIPVLELLSGFDFIDGVERSIFTDKFGYINDILVSGYKSNLGIFSDKLKQGNFMVSISEFKKLCSEYEIQVNWGEKSI